MCAGLVCLYALSVPADEEVGRLVCVQDLHPVLGSGLLADTPFSQTAAVLFVTRWTLGCC